VSASGPPLCRICQKEHWAREPHILPANTPMEKRSTAKVNAEIVGKLIVKSRQALALETKTQEQGSRVSPRASARKPAKKKAKRKAKKHD
jgi:hypothetical protein